MSFDNLAEELYAFLSGLGARKNDIDDVIFGNTGLFVVRVDCERIVTRKNRLGSRNGKTDFVKADSAVQFGLPVRNGGVAHRVSGLRVNKIRCAVMILCAIHFAGGIILGRVNKKQLGLKGGAVRAAGHDE